MSSESRYDTISWKCTIGTNEGYDLTRQRRWRPDELAEICMEIADQVNEETNVYISITIEESRVLYKKEWGCPAGGEYAYTIYGCCNPAFSEKEAYLNALDRYMVLLKERMHQETVLLEILPAQIKYLNSFSASAEKTFA